MNNFGIFGIRRLNDLFMKMYIFLIFGFLAFLLPKKVLSQINIKVGYTLDYSDYTQTNIILNEFNRTSADDLQKFKPFHFNHGLQLGIRLKKENLAFDFGVERISATRTGASNNASYEIKNRINRILAGLELHGKLTGLGVNFYYEQFRYIDADASSKIISSDGDFGNKVYLIYKLPGSKNLSLNIQPYVMLPWTASNVFGIHEYLKNEASLTSYNQRNIHYGISFLFYNGKK